MALVRRWWVQTRPCGSSIPHTLLCTRVRNRSSQCSPSRSQCEAQHVPRSKVHGSLVRMFLVYPLPPPTPETKQVPQPLSEAQTQVDQPPNLATHSSTKKKKNINNRSIGGKQTNKSETAVLGTERSFSGYETLPSTTHGGALLRNSGDPAPLKQPCPRVLLHQWLEVSFQWVLCLFFFCFFS